MRRRAVAAAAAVTGLLVAAAALAVHLGAVEGMQRFLAPVPPVERRAAEGCAAEEAEGGELGPESPRLAALAKIEGEPRGAPPSLAGAANPSGAATGAGSGAAMGAASAGPGAPVETLPGLVWPEALGPRTPEVDAALARFRNDRTARDALASAHERCSAFRGDLEATLAAQGLPLELAAVAYIESRCREDEGDGDRVGLFGLRAPQATTYGLLVLPTYDERRNAVAASRAFGALLADLKERLGQWGAALLAYRRGYGPVAAALGDRGASSWTALGGDGRVGSAAVAYAAEVMAAAVALRNTDIFGLPSVTGDGAILRAVEVPAGAPLATIAQVARLRLADLRAMNPEYLGPVVPATGRRMLMRFPGRSVAHVSEGLLGMLYRVDTLAPEKVPEAELPSRGAAPSPRGEIAGQTSEGLYYRWRDGDTLPAVASRFQTTPAALAEDNALRGDDLPAPGALIFVRRAPSAAPSSPAPPPAVPKGRGPRRKKP